MSHGEHLRQAADSLERAPSATQRDLRAHTLGTTFRALANAGGGILTDSVAQFALAAREAVASGVAVNNAAGFAAELRRVGDLLARSSTGDEEVLGTELDARTAAIRALPSAAPVVPIEALAPAAPRSSAPPAPPPRSAGDDSVPESPDLVGSWAAYQRLAQAGIGRASLEELIAPAPAVAAAFAASAAPAALAVDVRTLLYRGERALNRAQELRAAARQASGDSLRALVEEVCDLVALALEPSPNA